MIETCPYCNSLHKAIKNENYCSNKGDNIAQVSSNAYYFKSTRLFSGQHISRLSIRTISDGFQKHTVGNHQYMLDQNRYLVIPEGAPFESQIETNNPVEGVLVAFNKRDSASMSHTLHATPMQMLDDPYNEKKLNLELSTREMGAEFKVVLDNLKLAMKNGLGSSMYYSELFQEFLALVISDSEKVNCEIDRISAKKGAIRKEIHKRISRTKEYINCNLEKDLSLDQLSKVAMMSSFYFLRNFKKVNHIAPHKYISQQRIEKAKFWLKDTNDSLDSIIDKVGFENKSSFARLFKRNVGLTTTEYRARF